MQYTEEQLAEIIENHAKWLSDEDDGQRANLRGADLREANLCEANLRRADLSGANLRGSDLRGSDLRGADLSGADLCGANLRGADLRGADLRGADLSGADLREADLSRADLREADLREADLSRADLSRASGNMCEVKAMQCDYWPVTYTHDVMQIGCQKHKIEDWRKFDDAEISQMDSKALSWWKIWKPIIFQIIDASPAVPHGGVKPE